MQSIDLRTNQFNVRLNDDESDRLEELAQHYGLSTGNVVRLILKRASDELRAGMAASAPPPRKPRGKR